VKMVTLLLSFTKMRIPAGTRIPNTKYGLIRMVTLCISSMAKCTNWTDPQFIVPMGMNISKKIQGDVCEVPCTSYKNDFLHRDGNEPAWTDGKPKVWYVDKHLHRDDGGPAIIEMDYNDYGDPVEISSWYQHNVLSRRVVKKRKWPLKNGSYVKKRRRNEVFGPLRFGKTCQ
jgi:hypothetical protein